MTAKPRSEPNSPVSKPQIEDTITLNGKFTVKDLEAIIKFMKENAT